MQEVRTLRDKKIVKLITAQNEEGLKALTEKYEKLLVYITLCIFDHCYRNRLESVAPHRGKR